MKVLQSSIFRAICAIVVGALLVKYREETVTWLTVAIGALFFLSGLISCIVYVSSKRKDDTIKVFDEQGKPLAKPVPAFPIVGIGSMVLGAMLALAPALFVSGLMYVLAAILILGAINQFFNLASATKYAHVGLAWWLLPTIILLIGLIAVIKPGLIASAPLFVIGWCMMVYGMVDLINAIKVHRCRKAYEKAHAATEGYATEVTHPAPLPQQPVDTAPSGGNTTTV